MTPTLDTFQEISSLKTRLLALPSALAGARREAAEATSRAATDKEAIKQAEAEVLLLVSGETVTESTADGKPGKVKPAYANAESRTAEAGRRLATDPRHQARVAQFAEADAERVRTAIAVQQLEDEHRALRGVADLTVAEVSLLTAGH